MIRYMEYDQAVKIFGGPTAALQLICFKNRMSEKLKKNESEPIEIIESSSVNRTREWPEQFIFPHQNINEPLASKLKKPTYELDRWDIVKIIRVLFNEMILYRM